MHGRDVQPTAKGVFAAVFASAAVIAHLVAGKAVRDALFLAHFDVALLPRMMVLGALASLVAALTAARALERRSPARLLFAALGASAALYAVEWALLERATQAVAIALYVHVSAIGTTFVAALWSLVNERFDPHTAKREFGRIALGGSFGGVLAGIASWFVSAMGGLSQLIGVLFVLNLLTMATIVVLSRTSRSLRREEKRAAERSRRSSALRALRESPFLATLALLVALVALGSALLDYVLSARVVAVYTDGARLAAFFALFHASLGVLAMLAHLVLSRATLERLGLAGTVALLPGVVLALGPVALGFPSLWSAALLRGSEGLVQASLFRASYELFYTPLPRAQKRPTKILIDVGVDRLGTIAGAGLALLAVSSLGATANVVLVGLAMFASFGALICASRLHRGYVDALAGRLRRGTLKLDVSAVFDATTRRTLAETTSLDRRELLGAIERQRSERPGGADEGSAQTGSDERDDEVVVFAPSGGAGFEAAPGYVGIGLASPEPLDSTADAQGGDAVLRAIGDLRSNDVDRVRAVLSAPITPELVAHVVPLLGRDEVARDALRALRSVAERATGTLADALLDSSREVAVRRRIPRVFDRIPSPRAVRALIDGLFEGELAVRHQSALALLRLAESGAVALPSERILDAVELEVSAGRPTSPIGASDAELLDDGPGFADDRLRARGKRDLEHVMTLLALVLEREQMRLAYHALHAEEPAIRGTALEYLENVLPERVKRGVLGLVVSGNIHAPRQGSRARDARTLAEELERSREIVMPASLRAPERGTAS